VQAQTYTLGGMNENDIEWLKNCRFKVGKEKTRYKDIV
jgi:hypothetical protein